MSEAGAGGLCLCPAVGRRPSSREQWIQTHAKPTDDLFQARRAPRRNRERQTPRPRAAPERMMHCLDVRPDNQTDAVGLPAGTEPDAPAPGNVWRPPATTEAHATGPLPARKRVPVRPLAPHRTRHGSARGTRDAEGCTGFQAMHGPPGWQPRPSPSGAVLPVHTVRRRRPSRASDHHVRLDWTPAASQSRPGACSGRDPAWSAVATPRSVARTKRWYRHQGTSRNQHTMGGHSSRRTQARDDPVPALTCRCRPAHPAVSPTHARRRPAVTTEPAGYPGRLPARLTGLSPPIGA